MMTASRMCHSERAHDSLISSAERHPVGEPQVTVMHQMVSAKNLVYIIGGMHGVEIDAVAMQGERRPSAEDEGDEGLQPPSLLQLNVSQPVSFARLQTTSLSLRSLIGHTAVLIDERHIITLFGKGVTHGRRSIFAGIMRFDIEKLEWKEYLTHGAPDRRWGHTSVYDPLTNKVYLHGGILANGTVEQGLHILNLDTRHWDSRFPPKDAKLPHSVAFSSAGVLNKFYVSCFGTNGLDAIPNNDCLLYNLETHEFLASSQDSPILSRSHSSIVATPQRDRLFMFGGVNMATHTTFNDAWILDGSQLPLVRWITPNISDVEHAPSRRYGHFSVQLSGSEDMHLALFWGGLDLQGRGDTALHVLDTSRWTWEQDFDGIFSWRGINKWTILGGIFLFLVLSFMAILMCYRIKRPSSSSNGRHQRSSKVRDYRPILEMSKSQGAGRYALDFTPSSNATSYSPMASRSSNQFSSLSNFQLPTQSYADSFPRMRQWKTEEEERKLQQRALIKRIKEIPGKPAEYLAEKWSNLKRKRPFRRISKRRRMNQLHQLLHERKHTLCPQYDEQISARVSPTNYTPINLELDVVTGKQPQARSDSLTNHSMTLLPPAGRKEEAFDLSPSHGTMSLGRESAARRLPQSEIFHRKSSICFPISSIPEAFGAESYRYARLSPMTAIGEEADFMKESVIDLGKHEDLNDVVIHDFGTFSGSEICENERCSDAESLSSVSIVDVN